MTSTDLKDIAQTLDDHPDYRVVRRFVPPDHYYEENQQDKLKGIFLDVETTGLDSTIDHVIELALVTFEFNSEGKIFRVLDRFDQLHDPNKPLDPEIVRITGITDEILKNQCIDDDLVQETVDQAALIIAHNARFDRPFVEQRWPIFEKKAWACSLTQIPWQQNGFESAKLEYLAYRFGFFFDGHRAEIDCLAGIEILSKPLDDSGTLALKTLLDQARKKTYRVWAIGSAFEAKDTLKARGYRWNNGDNGKPKSWFRDLNDDEYTKEVVYLKESILRPGMEPLVDTISAFDRFSDRN